MAGNDGLASALRLALATMERDAFVLKSIAMGAPDAASRANVALHDDPNGDAIEIARKALEIDSITPGPFAEPRPLMVTVKSVYGARKVYPNNDAAQLFAAIARTKTLSVTDLARARVLGFAIVIDATEADAQEITEQMNRYRQGTLVEAA